MTGSVELREILQLLTFNETENWLPNFSTASLASGVFRKI